MCVVPRTRLSGGTVADNLGLRPINRQGRELCTRSLAPEMTMETTPKPRWLRIVLGFLVLSTGLSTIFMGVVTAWQAWEEHVQERWPEVRAHVDTCELSRRAVVVRGITSAAT